MVKVNGANYSFENSLLLSLDNIGGGYRYCAAEKMRASSPINSSRKIAKQAAPVNGRDKRLRAIDSRSLFHFSADKAGKHKLCLPALISD